MHPDYSNLEVSEQPPEKCCFDRIVRDYFKSFFSLSLLLTLTMGVLISPGTTCHVFLLEMEGDVKMKLGFKTVGSLDFLSLFWTQICMHVKRVSCDGL